MPLTNQQAEKCIEGSMANGLKQLQKSQLQTNPPWRKRNCRAVGGNRRHHRSSNGARKAPSRTVVYPTIAGNDQPP
ncbi:MAG: hypothetical protein JAY63_10510 [Candidatus Thiodiazotropha taylori]|nr:hypothetical protein [Candidatus Thiodiazotropha taylori]